MSSSTIRMILLSAMSSLPRKSGETQGPEYRAAGAPQVGVPPPHSHDTHWKERTLSHLRSLHIPLFCPPEHQPALQEYSKAFLKLQKDGLARTYEAGCALALAPDLCCRPLPLRHDGGATF